MKRKSLFFEQGKHSSPDELIRHLNKCCLNPKFIENKQKVNVMEQYSMFLDKIEIKRTQSIERDKSVLINRQRLQKEYLRFLLTTDGPTSVFYQSEKKKQQIKIQDNYELGQQHICLSKMLGQKQELVNPF